MGLLLLELGSGSGVLELGLGAGVELLGVGVGVGVGVDVGPGWDPEPGPDGSAAKVKAAWNLYFALPVLTETVTGPAAWAGVLAVSFVRDLYFVASFVEPK